MVTVNNPNDINEIYEKIIFVINNKEEMNHLYDEFKATYESEVVKLKEEFIKI